MIQQSIQSYSKSFPLLLFLTFIGASNVYAHHGKDFFTTASLQLPQHRQLFGILSSSYTKNLASLSLEPGVLYGMTDRWGIEVHGHLEEINTHPGLASIGLEQRFMLWNNITTAAQTENGLPVAIGILVEFEKGLGHHHSGVELRGLLTYMGEEVAASVNLVGVKEFRDEPLHVGYALGIRRSVLQFVALGLEARGAFNDTHETVVTPNIFFELTHTVNLLVGTSIPFSHENRSTTVRAALLFEF